jgi:mannitol/fructose-specific phosphotransferase system IIA component
MTKDDIIKLAIEHTVSGLKFDEDGLVRFAILVAKQQREEDAKLVESMTLEWPDQPEFAQVERTTIQDCATIIRQRVVTYD